MPTKILYKKHCILLEPCLCFLPSYRLSTNWAVAVASNTFNWKSEEKEFLVTNLLTSHICLLFYSFKLMPAQWISLCYWCQCKCKLLDHCIITDSWIYCKSICDYHSQWWV